MKVLMVPDSGVSIEVMQYLADATIKRTESAYLQFEIIRPGAESPGVTDAGSVALDHMRTADVVAFDVTQAPPNTMMQLGAARALNKPIIFIARSAADLQLDLASVRVLIYGDDRTTVSGDFLMAWLDALDQVKAQSVTSPSGGPDLPSSATVFVSYSHVDDRYLKRLLVHLRPLERKGLIEAWSDTRIKGGDQWREEIASAIRRARVAVLLISADFLASEFIADNELPPLLAQAQARGSKILPLILFPCRYSREPELARFQAMNDPRTPLASMKQHQQESVLDSVAEMVELSIASVVT
ncbi:TIR domain-containing protein [Streptomyces chattanoogensis]|uniref:TIR domain-containing protein n=1 Tax=Streptomyces chattanoogensis TaxID=66876 RepID=UPI0036A84C08